jgi:hypothetical protein
VWDLQARNTFDELTRMEASLISKIEDLQLSTEVEQIMDKNKSEEEKALEERQERIDSSNEILEELYPYEGDKLEEVFCDFVRYDEANDPSIDEELDTEELNTLDEIEDINDSQETGRDDRDVDDALDR